MAGDGLHLFDEEETVAETPQNSAGVETSADPIDEEEQKEAQEEEQRYLLFSIGTSVFSTKLMDIREVIGMVEYQNVPNTKKYFLGMANIRGEVVGLIDACVMLGIQEQEQQDRAAIIICDTEHGAIGVKVDEVYGVREIVNDLVDQMPQVDSIVPQKYMQGIAKLDDKLVAVVELRKLLSDSDMILLKKASNV